jgi:endonuclease YncB( thermonuclease family)
MKINKFTALFLSLAVITISAISCVPTPADTSQTQPTITSTQSQNSTTLPTMPASTTTITPFPSTSQTTISIQSTSSSQPKTTTVTTKPTIRTTTSTTVTISTRSTTTSTASLPTTTTPSPLTTTGEATVVRIIDGDTIDVSISGKTFTVRYIGMDTPEKGDKFYQEATDKNSELVNGKIVRLEKDVSEVDKMDNPRLLRYVYIGDIFVNAELVRLGYARATPYPPDVKYESLFSTLENEAKAAQLGMWAPALLSLQIVSVTSPVKAGTSATLVAQTKSNAECAITVYLKSGPSTAAGLTKKNADSDGKASWTWKIGSSTTPGTYKIVVTAGLGGETVSQTTYFTIQ